LSGLLEGGLPLSNSRRVREDGEFGGVVEVSDSLGEFLLNEVESVGLATSGEAKRGGHRAGDIEKENDFTSGDTEKVTLGLQVIEDLSGFILGGDISERVNDGELVFDIDDVVLEGSEGIEFVVLEVESDQDGDNLFAS